MVYHWRVTRTHAGRQRFCRLRRARFPHPNKASPVLIAGHLVRSSRRHAGQLKWRAMATSVSAGHFDMKAAITSSWKRLRQLARAAFTRHWPITVLFTPIEVGRLPPRQSSESRAARTNNVRGCPSLACPPTPSSTGRSHRTVQSEYDGQTESMPAHALFGPPRLIREMARQIIAIDGMTTGRLHLQLRHRAGVQWSDCVATTMFREALEHGEASGDLDRCVERMPGAFRERHDVTFKVTRGVTRLCGNPRWPWRCMKRRAVWSTSLGHRTSSRQSSAGGGSDGKFHQARW